MMDQVLSLLLWHLLLIQTEWGGGKTVAYKGKIAQILCDLAQRTLNRSPCQP